jgi:hypothetical protein
MDKYAPSERDTLDAPAYPAQTELCTNEYYCNAAQLKKVIDNVDFPTANATVSDDGEQVDLIFIKDAPSIRIVRYTPCARYFTLKYKVAWDMSITVYPNPSRASAVGGEEIFAKLTGGDDWNFLHLDLMQSPEFAKYGPFMASFMIKFNDVCQGDTVTLANAIFSSEVHI